MPFYQVTKSYVVPKLDGSGHYSRGTVLDMPESQAAEYSEFLLPYTINDGAHGPEPTKSYTRSQIDAIIAEAVANARAEWEAELAAAQVDPKAARLKALSAMKLDDLRAIANDTEIENMHDLKKAELVTAIMEIEFPVAPAS